MKIVSDPAEAPGGWPLFATAPKVIDAVGRFKEAGVDHFVLDTFYNLPELHGETVDTMLETVERFSSALMPHFNG